MSPRRRWLPARTAALLLSLAPAAGAQASGAALRFHGTPGAQQDRVRIPIDDDGAGPDASAPADVGAGDFTIELWLRGTAAANPAPGGAGDQEYASNAWISGAIVVDRRSGGSSEAGFGVSIAGGHVAFGTGGGDGPSPGAPHTLEGSDDVLDDAWHHVALVRDAATGRKRIYVDGLLDVESSAGASTADLSFPNGGVHGAGLPWGPYLVLAADKFDAGGPGDPFVGFLDELRVWDVARTAEEIVESFDRTVPPDAAGLVGAYRFEEGAGTLVLDGSAAGSPPGELIAGLPGNGEWTSALDSPFEVAPIGGGGLPPGFVRTEAVGGLVEPTAIEIAGDGRIFIAERAGAVRLFEDGALQPAPVYEFPASIFVERGLVGLALDPDFATNGHLYAYWTTTEPRNQVSRVTVQGSTADPQSEVVIWQNSEPAGDFHHGGALAFGPDGRLYVSTGDQLSASHPQDLSVEHGKILRIAPDGSIPPDNPFVGIGGVAQTIWAYGLRNPFRMSFDELTGELWIGDVGSNGVSSEEEIDLGAAGANYGAPDQEGEQCFVGDCSPFTFPAYSYVHDDPEVFLVFPQASITLGPVYRGSQFPPAYQGSIFFGDFANRWIRRLVRDAAGEVVGAPFFSPVGSAGTIVDLEVGPDGALWFVALGTDWAGIPDTPAVYRVVYAGLANQAPVAVASAAPTAGPAPLAVQFDGGASSDPDAGPAPLAHSWDFGDGEGSTEVAPLHVYDAPGEYAATLTVTDGAVAQTAAAIEVVVGNPPAATIATPLPGAVFEAGDSIAFSGSATDADDGPLPASAFTWEVVLLTKNGELPFLGPMSGVKQGSFQIPTSGFLTEDTSYEVRLSVVDSDGLGDVATAALAPKTSVLVLDTVPPGIPLVIDGKTEPTPRVFESLVGFQHQVAAPAFDLVQNQAHGFSCWSDGGAQAHAVVAPVGGENLTAVFEPAPTSLFAQPILAGERNAEWSTLGGQSFASAADPGSLCLGRDALGPLEVGLEFPIAVPQGATVVSAELVLVPGGGASFGPTTATVWAYDVADAPPFVEGSPTPITQHAPLGRSSVTWNLPSFASPSSVASPDLAPLVQAVVDRPDWTSGNHVGIVLDGAPTSGIAQRCIANAASGMVPRLRVGYTTAAVPPGDCSQACGFTTYGAAATPVHTLGLTGIGAPVLGSPLQILTNGLPPAAPGAYTLVSAAQASFPFAGGTALADPTQIVLFLFFPATQQDTTSWVLPIPQDPTLVGVSLYLQSFAVDLGLPGLLAFSNGLEIEICP